MNKHSKSDGLSESGTQTSDKQKISILKKAVIELREHKAQLEISNQSLSAELAKVLKEKEENESCYIQLIEDLRQKISILEGNNISTPKRIQSQNTFNNVVEINKNDDSNLNKQLKQLQQEMTIMQNNYQAQLLISQHEQNSLQKEISNKESILAKLSKELDDANLQNKQLKKNIEDLEQNLYNKIIELSQQNTEIKIKLANQESQYQDLDQKYQQKDDIVQQLKCQIQDLEEMRGKFLQQKLILKNQLLEINCAIIFRQNIYNEYIFELETAAKKFTYKMSEITDLLIKDDKQFIIVMQKRQEMFKINPDQDIRKVCKSIKSFLVKYQNSINNQLQ